ncbi:hypothetical protein BB8028_0004g12270 [Beauveria bassiana]|uniref:Alpha/beta hydrolase fold-3 domain-containing protein n=1 Tax=Beauveria bassiana TaxID=176275 RepID=A0A2S7YDW8_BEABA|nr:hypothetical protein BB8028_0004g12270 [Beauveria bassiana]
MNKTSFIVTMLEKITKVYANHGMPIECDIYTPSEPVPDAPVALFFHAGALSGWGRDCVPPWLAQTCYKQKWPLISASYRLMPQTGTDGLAEDVTAAYDFAQNWDCSDGKKRTSHRGRSQCRLLPRLLPRPHRRPATRRPLFHCRHQLLYGSLLQLLGTCNTRADAVLGRRTRPRRRLSPRRRPVHSQRPRKRKHLSSRGTTARREAQSGFPAPRCRGGGHAYGSGKAAVGGARAAVQVLYPPESLAGADGGAGRREGMVRVGAGAQGEMAADGGGARERGRGGAAAGERGAARGDGRAEGGGGGGRGPGSLV